MGDATSGGSTNTDSLNQYQGQLRLGPQAYFNALERGIDLTNANMAEVNQLVNNDGGRAAYPMGHRLMNNIKPAKMLAVSLSGNVVID